MCKRFRNIGLVLLMTILCSSVFAQMNSYFSRLEKDFVHPPQSVRPWVFWYWVNGYASKEGITADLEAMKKVGLGGAYLMFIKDTIHPSPYNHAVSQLSADWFKLVSFAIEEAKRLNLQLGFHVSDGFALAGGPWITPELSMQKVVWSKVYVSGNKKLNDSLPLPEVKENYYRDIAVYAYPTSSQIISTKDVHPLVTTSNGLNADFLWKIDSKESFKTDSAAWIQYAFEKPFTCKTIVVKTNGNNYQAHRLIIQSSNDAINFKTITRLIPPRHGWQDTDADVTHSIPSTTAKYFRFVYDKNDTEPGAEDLDNAKWKPSLKVSGIELLNEATINQYESKNGEVWRISNRTTEQQIANNECVPFDKLVNITSFYKNGKLQWNVPKGNWVIIRIGHTSTGHKNETAGGGKGLECDKFNTEAIQLQFKNWFEKIYNCVDESTAKEVIKVFHVDSWECGSQNWSEKFAIEFKKRRGYDLLPYLPVMAGVPVQSVQKSEFVLYDVRKTIAELIGDVFYATLKKLSADKNCLFSAESVAPTMMSDGMLHYQYADLPMGEFWNNSPTHDKPNDMLDAISAAHVYGKNIVQAEAFTTLRMNWNEGPANLKSLGDRNFALGINKMSLHVFIQNPWLNKKPAVTLDPIGLYYQRNQTWFDQSKVWIDYLSRCQLLLQQGKPVNDIAVFTGEELPRRSVLPDRLVNTLPGIFGKEKVEAEKKRLQNTNQPLRQIPDGVSHSANMADPENWVNALNGYNYDSFNPDVLMNMKVVDGIVETSGGAKYKLLVLPAAMKMNPDNIISETSLQKIKSLVNDGATVLLDKVYVERLVANGLKLNFQNQNNNKIALFGKGKFVLTPFMDSSFQSLAVERDMEVLNKDVRYSDIAFAHRKLDSTDVYFISNQNNKTIMPHIGFRVKNKHVEIWDGNTGAILSSSSGGNQNEKINGWLVLEPNESKFIVFRNGVAKWKSDTISCFGVVTSENLHKGWKVKFDEKLGGPAEEVLFDSLQDWSKNADDRIKYYSGTAIYKNTFQWKISGDVFLRFDNIQCIASVKVNGIDCGTLWTAPYKLNITKAIKREGVNELEIAVTNTWNNRLVGDSKLPPEKRITYTVYPFDWSKKQLQLSGLIGRVSVSQ